MREFPMVANIARSTRGVLRRPRRLAGLGLCLTLAACGGAHDTAGGLTKEDYEALKARRPAAEATTMAEPPIPDLAPVLAAPQPPLLADSRRVTVQATEVTAVKDLLIEIARQADIDLELDPRIEGGVIITARDRPLADVIERIADLAGLRYRLENNRLRVEQDDPYLHSYRMDVLALSRTTTTSISSSTDVFTAVGDGGGAAGGNSSTAAVTSESGINFWDEISQNITAIIAQAAPEPRTAGATGPDVGVGADAIPATATAPAAAAEAPAAPGAEAEAPGAPGATAVQQQAEAIAQATAAAGTPEPAPAAGAADPAAAAGGAAAEGNGHFFTVNRQAGIITIYATERQQKEVADYLEAVRRSVGAQVLIEAKIIEVNLNEQFRAGIDWAAISERDAADFGIVSNFSESVVTGARTVPTLLAGGSFTLGAAGISGLLQLVDQFGTTRTLSSPRLTVLNNQNAILKVAENEVYFTIEVDRDIVDGNVFLSYETEVHTVPVGVILNVQPSINLDTQEISMNLRPTISRIVRTVDNPGIAIAAAEAGREFQSPIPVVEVRELDSLVTVQSGDVLILGGLMQERAENIDEGVPGVKDIPVVGSPFKKKLEDTDVIELVIFLRATIVNGRDSITPADRELYNKFTPDPRPIAF